LLAMTAIATGFALATLKSVSANHPILASTAYSADVAGFVEVREERERSDGRGGIRPGQRPGQGGGDEPGKSEGEEPGRRTVGKACAQRGVVVI